MNIKYGFVIYLLVLLLSLTCHANGQIVPTENDSTPIKTLFLQELRAFPQEKTYIHTDRSSYVLGDTVWIRIHLVDAILLKQANASRYVYVDLIDPLNNPVSRIMLRPDTLGYFHGHLALNELLSEGEYTLCAYTRFMQNISEEYFYRKPIQIIDPLSESIVPNIQFILDGKQCNVEIFFKAMAKELKIIPENCEILIDNQKAETLKFDIDSIARYKLRANKQDKILQLKAVYNGKIYSRFFSIPDTDNSFHVSFFPEGGGYPVGVDGLIAFKSINKDGFCEPVNGFVYDDTGKECLAFKNQHLGMGRFMLNYAPNRTYYAICTNERGVSLRFELPPPSHEAIAIQASWQKNYLKVGLLKPNDSVITEPLQLVAHIRGVVFYEEFWMNTDKLIFFEDTSLPDGIVHLMLLDKERNILSERLVYSLQKTSFAGVTIDSDKESYGKREKIELTIGIKDVNSKPLTGNFSIAVVDAQDAFSNHSSSILSGLLLETELKGFIESPMSYFTMESRRAVQALDLLMMTQGWRRYNVANVLKGKITAKLEHPLEYVRTISGKSSKMFSKVKAGSVSYLAVRDSVIGTDFTLFDENGRFSFEAVEYPDSTWFIVQSHASGGGKNFVELDVMNHLPTIKALSSPSLISEPDSVLEQKANYVTRANQKYAINQGIRVINLAEVEIVANRLKKKIVDSPFYSVTASEVIGEDEIKEQSLMFVYDLLRTLPGVTVSGNKVMYRGAEPLLILDDMPSEDYSYDDLDIDDITTAFVVPAVSVMPILGQRAANGAIIINTKKGVVRKHRISSNIRTIRPIGYQQTVEFYSPKYETKEEKEQYTPDLRSTIYWKPNIRIDEGGKTKISFYSADTNSRYQIVIEGVSEEGHLIYSNEEYMSIGDIK